MNETDVILPLPEPHIGSLIFLGSPRSTICASMRGNGQLIDNTLVTLAILAFNSGLSKEELVTVSIYTGFSEDDSNRHQIKDPTLLIWLRARLLHHYEARRASRG